MAYTIRQRLQHAWNAFQSKEESFRNMEIGPSYTSRPDRNRLHLGNERSIISSVYTRIGIDCSAIALQHVRLDQNGSFLETIDSGLNYCFNVEANIDQTGRSFIQDVVMSMCDEGCVAIVPVDTTINPKISGSFDIQSMRTGKILEWMPAHVRVSVYNEQTGNREDLILEKRRVAIIENPLYSVMNEPNSTLKRLISKLNLLDVSDDKISGGKLDILVSLPYVVKTEKRVEQANARIQQIEDQLAGRKYGIAYVDSTEKVTQLNRPAENNLMEQIEFLTSMLHSQLGLTQAVFDGTADEKEMLNYHARTIDPILSAICGETDRTFITKTARSQGQAIRYYRNPFGLVPAKELADISDSFTRNEILTSNEVRSVIGFKPSKEKGADELRNKNLNPEEAVSPPQKPESKMLKGDGSNDRSKL